MIYNPPQLPDDLSDKDVITTMLGIRSARLTQNIQLARFVRSLNRRGYPIEHAEYLDIETYPLKARPHIENDLVTYAAAVLNDTRAANTSAVQSPASQRATQVLARARLSLGLTYDDVAHALTTEYQVPTSTAQYRTAEQGIMKSPPFDMIISAAHFLGVPIGDICP
jgi:hypothetical protein